MGSSQSAPVSPPAPPVTPEDAANAFIDGHLESAQVVLFGRTNCGHCDVAKRVLRAETLRARRTGCAEASPPRIVNLDAELHPLDARNVIAALAERTGAATVPRVFVGGNFIGGATETTRASQVGTLGAALRRAAGCKPTH